MSRIRTDCVSHVTQGHSNFKFHSSLHGLSINNDLAHGFDDNVDLQVAQEQQTSAFQQHHPTPDFSKLLARLSHDHRI